MYYSDEMEESVEEDSKRSEEERGEDCALRAAAERGRQAARAEAAAYHAARDEELRKIDATRAKTTTLFEEVSPEKIQPKAVRKGYLRRGERLERARRLVDQQNGEIERLRLIMLSRQEEEEENDIARRRRRRFFAEQRVRAGQTRFGVGTNNVMLQDDDY